MTTLAAHAPDPAVQKRAAIILDLMLLDLAVHSFHGTIASSRGRSYGSSKVTTATHTVTTNLNLRQTQHSCGVLLPLSY